TVGGWRGRVSMGSALVLRPGGLERVELAFGQRRARLGLDAGRLRDEGDELALEAGIVGEQARARGLGVDEAQRGGAGGLALERLRRARRRGVELRRDEQQRAGTVGREILADAQPGYGEARREQDDAADCGIDHRGVQGDVPADAAADE